MTAFKLLVDFVEENFRTNTRTTELILRSRVKKALDLWSMGYRHCAPIERTRPNPHCIRSTEEDPL